MYHFRDGTSPNDLYFQEVDVATGTFGASGETPYHGTYAMAPPIRVSPDGARVLIGSRFLFDGIDMTYAGQLPAVITDALWREDGLVTIRPDGSSTRLERRDLALALQGSETLPGAPLRIFEWSGGLLVVTTSGGQPAFHLVAP
jgi:hypothetical protein